MSLSLWSWWAPRVTEAQVLEAVSHYAGWGYGTGSATRYPETLSLPSSVPRSAIRTPGALPLCDCSTLTTGAVLAAHQVDDRQLYADLMLAHGDQGRPWSPPHALASVTGRSVRDELEPGVLHLVQAWRGLAGGRIVPSGPRRSRGHSFLARQHVGGAVQVWESTDLHLPHRAGGGVRTITYPAWSALLAARSWDEARCTPVV